MPLYDFHCDHCHTTFEVRASFQEKERGLEPLCPNCQSADTRQVLAIGLFLNKGGNNDGSITPPYCGPNSGAGCCG